MFYFHITIINSGMEFTAKCCTAGNMVVVYIYVQNMSIENLQYLW